MATVSLPASICVAIIPVITGFILSSVPGPPTVSTAVGDIVGFWQDVSIYGKTGKVGTFMGIPYAEPPVGDQRFRKPTPKARFTTPFNASNSISCLQERRGMTQGKRYTEDCLVLNVFVPQTSSQSPLPVMIWIHGGGFITGSSLDYPGQLMSTFGEVIIVTVNYRLAVYGFLSTGDSNSPGNYGLWDQHLAINWVHDHIKAFGGDAGKVTIFGESAGAASVIYQALYPGNKGLIQRAIAESGTAASSWAFTVLPGSEAKAAAFAKKARCFAENWDGRLFCLRTNTTQEINDTVTSMPFQYSFDEDDWLPVIDGEIVLQDPRVLFNNYLDLKVRAMLNSIDLMMGVNSIDGVIYASFWQTEINMDLSDINELINMTRAQYLQVLAKFPAYVAKTNVPSILDTAIDVEFTDWSDPQNPVRQLEMLTKASTDLLFTVPSLRTAYTHASSNSAKGTYFYMFTVPPPFHILPVPEALNRPDRANHADEIPFVFGSLETVFEPNVVTSEQVKVSKAMMTMWTNFAKSGDPNQPVDATQYIGTTWPQYDVTNRTYLEISTNMGPGSVKHRLAARSDAWVTLATSVSQTVATNHCPNITSSNPSNPVLVG